MPYTPSLIQTVTVGPVVATGQLTLPREPLADYTAGGEFRPALKTKIQFCSETQYTLPSAKMQAEIFRRQALYRKERMFYNEEKIF